MTEEWRPLGVEPDDEVYFELHEGISEWLRKSLVDWVAATVVDHGRPVYPPVVSHEVVKGIERVLRVKVTSSIGEYEEAASAARILVREFEGRGKEWQLIDYLVSVGANAEQLLYILEDASSVWTIGTRSGRPALERRLTDGAAQAIAAVGVNAGNAGKRLSNAFEAAYGVDPDPSKAYSLAIKAVEDATIPVVSPANTKATLGTVIRDFKNAPTFRLPHNREHEDAPTHTVVLGMMQMLWVGQTDRHGGPASVGVPPVSQSEAEAAVMLAVPLVEWFTSGKVKKGV